MADAKTKAENILTEIKFDFRNFTIGGFVEWVSAIKQREILTIPWKMPAGLFGAWISDADEPKEYIFFREDTPKIHQIHIQLHELAHLLCGHPTARISRHEKAGILEGERVLLIDESTLLRSTKDTEYEIEAEALASLIQQQAIRHTQIVQLLQTPSSNEKLAESLRHLGLV